MKIKKYIITCIIIYITICILTSAFIWFSQLTKESFIYRNEKPSTIGCDVDSAWTRVFYGKLFCQIGE